MVYINPRGTAPGSEEDDLNEYFLELSRAGLQFTYVMPGSETYQMAVVTPATRDTIFTKQAVAEKAPTRMMIAMSEARPSSASTRRMR